MQNKTISFKDNSFYKLSDVNEDSAEISILREVSGKSLQQFSDSEQIITIPESTRNEIVTDSPILTCDYNNSVQTGNIVGFIGNRQISLSITSRFAQGNSDFFIQYMLCKVLGINVTQFMFPSSRDYGLDLLPFLFPLYLKRALKQGIYRPYTRVEYNDSRLKGHIDISAHLKNNIPFRGTIAYNTRERIDDNIITQLIRHTIEVISTNKNIKGILSIDRDTINNVRFIRAITPSFNTRDLYKVLHGNRKKLIHPYFTYYSPLQTLCKLILMKQKGGFGESSTQFNGILIDVAWLWEEYLNIILKDIHIRHPRNRAKYGTVYVANAMKSHNTTEYKYTNIWERYPDFYTDEMVIDAKYKFISKEKIAREDVHQLITYMHIMNKKYGAFISPTNETCNEYDIFNLNGMGGVISLLRMSIPQHNILDDFYRDIQKSEIDLINCINDISI